MKMINTLPLSSVKSDLEAKKSEAAAESKKGEDEFEIPNQFTKYMRVIMMQSLGLNVEVSQKEL